MKMFQIIKPETRFDLLGMRRKAGVFSAILLAASVLALIFIGPSYGIDFKGGTELIMHFQDDVSDDDVRAAANSVGLSDATVQRYGTIEDRRFLIQTQAVSVVDQAKIDDVREGLAELGEVQRAIWSDEQPDRMDLLFAEAVTVDAIRDAIEGTGLANVEVERVGQAGEERFVVRFQDLQNLIVSGFEAHFGDAFDHSGLERLETVGPRVGEQLRNSGILSILIALMAILVYIWFRFDIRYSPGAVAALAHDITIAVGFFTITGLEITLPIIAALLTIVGYSLNDTIVVFDRIRENLESAGTKTVEVVVNNSLNETLSRTLVTSFTTLLAVTAIAVIGTGLIQDFAVALIVGIIIGTYSSVFVASPIMVRMDGYLRERKKAQELLESAEGKSSPSW